MLVLRTERLRLRWLTADDAPFILELVNDSDWIKFIGDREVRSVGQAREWIEANYIPSYWQHGFGLWAITRLSDDIPFGMCGLLRRDGSPRVEVGYALLPSSRGNGYAKEAASASVDYAHEVLRLESVVAVTAAQNLASHRLLDSLQFQRQPPTKATQDDQCVVFESIPGVPADREMDDEAEIRSIVGQFFNLFDNRAGAVPRLPMLPHLCMAGTVVTRISDLSYENSDTRAFMESRARLLSSGRLRDFNESEIEGTTRISGDMAQRWLTYRKNGFLDGQPYCGIGTKSLHFVRTQDGWRICAILWQDGVRNPATIVS